MVTKGCLRLIFAVLFTGKGVFGTVVPLGKDASATTIVTDTAKKQVFTEGILHARVSFPGHPVNELISRIDPGDENALQQIKEVGNNTSYSRRLTAMMNQLSEEERTSLGMMMMSAMMAPLYAKIYYNNEKVLAKSVAINYRLESFMDIKNKQGKIVAVSSSNTQSAAISFSASEIKNAWQKEEVGLDKYKVTLAMEKEQVCGYRCDKAVYTYKEKRGSAVSSGSKNPPYRIIIWSAPQFSSNINFFHPLYLQHAHGILKIEIHYDEKAKVKMVYEIVKVQAERLSNKDFMMQNVEPVINWDENPGEASANMLSVIFSSTGN